MRIIVPTIQHAGTWFTAYHLLKDHLYNGKDTLPHDKPGDGVVLHHEHDGTIVGECGDAEYSDYISRFGEFWGRFYAL